MNTRIYNIDLLRFVAAIMVLFYHYTFRGFAADNYSIIKFETFESFTKYGYLGVDLFFMISGFIILMSVQKSNLKSFIISRVCRLYPAYWVGLTVTSLFIILFQNHPFTISIYKYISNLTMIQAYLKSSNIDGAYWSLLVELHFYFLVAAMLYFKKIEQIEYFAITWLGVTLASVFFPKFILFSLIKTIFITHWSTYFIAGIFFFQIKKNGISVLRIIAIASSLFIAIQNAIGKSIHLKTEYATDFSATIISTMIIVFYAIMFLLSINMLEVVNNKKFLILGILTYPLYLVHQVVGYIILNNFCYNNKYFLLFTTTLFVIIIAYLIHFYIEKKFSPILKDWMNNLLKIQSYKTFRKD